MRSRRNLPVRLRVCEMPSVAGQLLCPPPSPAALCHILDLKQQYGEVWGLWELTPQYGLFAKFWLKWLSLGAFVFGVALAPAVVGVAPVGVCRGHRPSQRLSGSRSFSGAPRLVRSDRSSIGRLVETQRNACSTDTLMPGTHSTYRDSLSLMTLSLDDR